MTEVRVDCCTYCSKSLLNGIASCDTCGAKTVRARETNLRSPLLRKGYDDVSNRQANRAKRTEYVRLSETNTSYLYMFGLVLVLSFLACFFFASEADVSPRMFCFVFFPTTYCLLIHRELYGPAPLSLELKPFLFFVLKAVSLFLLFAVFGTFVQVELHNFVFMTVFIWMLCWTSKWGEKFEANQGRLIVEAQRRIGGKVVLPGHIAQIAREQDYPLGSDEAFRKGCICQTEFLDTCKVHNPLLKRKL